MKYLRLVLFALGAAGAATPAHAAIIGLGGGDIDPQSIFDPAPQPLVSGCMIVDPPYDAFCAQYEIFPDEEGGDFFVEDEPFTLHSIDFRLQTPLGGYYSTEFVGDCELGLCVDDETSDLDVLTASPLFDDGITFRLQDDSIHCFPGVPDCDAEFFSNTPSPGVSIVAVNGVASVPEPATLLLLAPAVVVRALRRRSKRS
jgi:hypothetical protein